MWIARIPIHSTDFHLKKSIPAEISALGTLQIVPRLGSRFMRLARPIREDRNGEISFRRPSLHAQTGRIVRVKEHVLSSSAYYIG